MTDTYEPTSREVKRRIAWVACEMWSAVLSGSYANPRGKRFYERMSNPVEGDIIMEMSTIYWLLHRDPDLEDDRWDGQLVPFLRSEMKTTTIGEPGDSYEFTEEVHICLNPDGTEFEWSNADIVAVPSGSRFLKGL